MTSVMAATTIEGAMATADDAIRTIFSYLETHQDLLALSVLYMVNGEDSEANEHRDLVAFLTVNGTHNNKSLIHWADVYKCPQTAAQLRHQSCEQLTLEVVEKMLSSRMETACQLFRQNVFHDYEPMAVQFLSMCHEVAPEELILHVVANHADGVNWKKLLHNLAEYTATADKKEHVMLRLALDFLATNVPRQVIQMDWATVMKQLPMDMFNAMLDRVKEQIGDDALWTPRVMNTYLCELVATREWSEVEEAFAQLRSRMTYTIKLDPCQLPVLFSKLDLSGERDKALATAREAFDITYESNAATFDSDEAKLACTVVELFGLPTYGTLCSRPDIQFFDSMILASGDTRACVDVLVRHLTGDTVPVRSLAVPEGADTMGLPAKHKIGVPFLDALLGHVSATSATFVDLVEEKIVPFFSLTPEETVRLHQRKLLWLVYAAVPPDSESNALDRALVEGMSADFLFLVVLAAVQIDYKWLPLLCDAGVDLNVAPTGRRLPVWEAYLQHKTQSLHTLVEHGANIVVGDVTARSKKERSVTLVARLIADGHLPECMDMLTMSPRELSADEKYTISHTFLETGVPKWIDWCVEQKIFGAVAPDGTRTLLHEAARKGDVETIFALLDAGVDATVCGSDGVDAMWEAVRHEHYNAAVAMFVRSVSRAANPEEDTHDESLLHVLARQDRLQILTTQMQRFPGVSADSLHVNARDALGRTPLWVAIKNNSNAGVLFAMQDALDVNIADNEGVTPLALAVYDNAVAKVKRLIEAGADPLLVPDGAPSLFEVALERNTKCALAILRSGKVDLSDALHIVLSGRHTALLMPLIELGADVNAPIDSSGRLPLHVATATNDVDVVRLLLKKTGAKIDAVDDEGHSALWVAAAGGHEDTLALLIREGADVMQEDVQGMSVLRAAFSNGQWDAVAALAKAGANVNVTDDNGYSPMYVASQLGHNDALIAMIRNGAECDVWDEDGRTLASVHCEEGDADVVDALVAAGANMTMCDQDGLQPVAAALHHGHEAMARKLILSRKVDATCMLPDSTNTLLHYFAASNDSATVTALIEMGAPLDTVGTDGLTALWRALEAKRQGTVLQLVEAGADVTIAHPKGESMVWCAWTLFGRDVVERLLRAGANPGDCDAQGRTLLHIFSQSGKVSSIELLLDAGVDVNVADKKGDTPLILASRGGHVDAITSLLTHGARIDVGADTPGHTAVEAAASKRHLRVVLQLLSHGAPLGALDVNSLTSRDGQTLLMLAARVGDMGLVERLVEAGAHLEATDKRKCTATMVALQRGHEELALRLIERGAVVPLELDTEHDTPLAVDGLQLLLQAVTLDLANAVKALVAVGDDGRTVSDTEGEWVREDMWLGLDLNREVDAESHRTVLHFAAELRGKEAILGLLLRARGSREACMKPASWGAHHQATPLMAAVCIGNARVVDMLLARQPRAVRMRDRDGMAVLTVACLRGHGAIAAALFRAGAAADENMCTVCGETRDVTTACARCGMLLYCSPECCANADAAVHGPLCEARLEQMQAEETERQAAREAERALQRQREEAARRQREEIEAVRRREEELEERNRQALEAQRLREEERRLEAERAIERERERERQAAIREIEDDHARADLLASWRRVRTRPRTPEPMEPVHDDDDDEEEVEEEEVVVDMSSVDPRERVKALALAASVLAVNPECDNVWAAVRREWQREDDDTFTPASVGFASVQALATAAQTPRAVALGLRLCAKRARMMIRARCLAQVASALECGKFNKNSKYGPHVQRLTDQQLKGRALRKLGFLSQSDLVGRAVGVEGQRALQLLRSDRFTSSWKMPSPGPHAAPTTAATVAPPPAPVGRAVVVNKEVMPNRPIKNNRAHTLIMFHIMKLKMASRGGPASNATLSVAKMQQLRVPGWKMVSDLGFSSVSELHRVAKARLQRPWSSLLVTCAAHASWQRSALERMFQQHGHGNKGKALELHMRQNCPDFDMCMHGVHGWASMHNILTHHTWREFLGGVTTYQRALRGEETSAPASSPAPAAVARAPVSVAPPAAPRRTMQLTPEAVQTRTVVSALAADIVRNPLLLPRDMLSRASALLRAPVELSQLTASDEEHLYLMVLRRAGEQASIATRQMNRDALRDRVLSAAVELLTEEPELSASRLSFLLWPKIGMALDPVLLGLESEDDLHKRAMHQIRMREERRLREQREAEEAERVARENEAREAQARRERAEEETRRQLRQQLLAQQEAERLRRERLQEEMERRQQRPLVKATHGLTREQQMRQYLMQQQALRSDQAMQTTGQAAPEGHLPEDQECSICYEELAGLEVKKLVPCGHKFCAGCVSKWRAQSVFKATAVNCPTCRSPITTVADA